MKKRLRPQKFILTLAFCAAAAVLFPIVRSNLPRMGPFLQSAGERLALLCAFSDLPDRSRVLLEKRFSGAAYSAPEEESAPPPEPAPPSSVPETSAPNAGAPVPPASSEAESSSSAPPESPKTEPPAIPEAYRGPMVEEDLSGGDSPNYLALEPAGHLRNYTDLSFGDIRAALEKPPSFAAGDAAQPQVLIYHTHATEAFERYDSETYDTRNNWRSTDNNMNMVAVGDALKKSLERGGVNVLHDGTQHDYPSYNGAYDRSAETIRGYLERYPSIKILLDVHRDAIDRNGTLVRPIATIGGKKAAQLMMIVGCDDGTMNMPEWRENLRLAALIQSQAAQDWEGLMRPIFFCYRSYNFNKAPGALLLEFGSHGNTLEECVYTAQLAGESIAKVIHALE